MPDKAVERDCRLIRVAPDGSLVLELPGSELHAVIEGLSTTDEVPDEHFDALSRLAGLPLKVVETGRTRAGCARVRLRYLAWHDKSGEVWRDVADVLSGMSRQLRARRQ
jgi:hypothetical protein